MNRELKFRVWNGVEWCGKIKVNQAVDVNDYDDINNLIFEQFTGLKDKNGKEIYEGDIIKISAGAYWTVKYGKYQDAEGENHFGFYLESHFACWSILGPSTIKVIGNIHENPELLK